HAGPELAAVEATGIVDPHVLQAQLAGAALHVVAQRLAALFRAAAARVPGGTAVGAAEDVRFVVRLGVTGLFAVAHDQSFLPVAILANCDQKACCICCICSMPCMEAGSQVLKIVSGFMASRLLRSRCSISPMMRSCMGLMSGRPKKARASSGVQVTSTFTFINPLRFRPAYAIFRPAPIAVPGLRSRLVAPRPACNA